MHSCIGIMCGVCNVCTFFLNMYMGTLSYNIEGLTLLLTKTFSESWKEAETMRERDDHAIVNGRNGKGSFEPDMERRTIVIGRLLTVAFVIKCSFSRGAD